MLALKGLKVLDLSRGYPGAYTCMFLADFGADVIKVDPLSVSLSLTPVKEAGEDKWAAYNAQDRNKRSIVINLKTKESRQILHKLVGKADVFVDPFRPGVTKRLGADYQTLRKINPRIIYCALTGYGQTGPYRNFPGHDSNYVALSGAMSITGEPGGPPCFSGNMIGDQAGGGLHAVIGILLALAARERTGEGQFVDISYVDGIISLMSLDLEFYFSTGVVPRRGETITTGATLWSNIYPTKDGGYITLGCGESHIWENLCRAIGREDLISKHWSTDKEKDKAFSQLQEIFRTKTKEEWFEFVKDKNISLTPVYDMDEVFSDPQVLQRQMLLEIKHPKFGKVKQQGIPIKLSKTPGKFRHFAPTPGQHTDEILRSLGYSKKMILALKEKKVVK